ncbi:type I polyketide synthase [Burkholderia gladioli]|uniref:type I polyketide synthase n=3 Tax=Burkholderia gladioli TaxID=28095 RepID=UPI0016414F81|nr:type I polyketide synthase [Burkholderia gladioli]
MTDMDKDLLLQSIQTIRELKTRLAQAERGHREAVAVVGVSLRFPGGVTDLDSYWALLREGRSGVIEVEPERWSNRRFVDSDYAALGKLVTPYAGLLERIYDFDAEFFGLSALEAENLDPQQRLLLEQSWLALEDAGYDIGRLRGSDTGVVVGIGSQDHGMALLADPAHANPYVASGNSFSMAAGRLSYFYDFSGPSLSIDTACSSSLVAVHEACRRLQLGECGLALAAGVNAMLTPHAGINFSRARMLSTERDCHTFDARAKGYVRGEGCAVLVLKRLADAQADGDRIHAVIRGVAINHDGHSSGLTVPNGSAQRAVIRAALRDAGVAPAEVDYVEAHGTGTRLGDPIEAHAIAEVYGEAREAGRPLAIGAVKANLGHLEAAAGLAGLIKAMLVLRHGEAPPQPGFETLNPAIGWDAAKFEVVRQPTPLRPAEGRPWLAGVSSFGFSGTNAHAVVAAPPAAGQDEPAAEPPGGLHVLALSAKTPEALERHVEEVAAYLSGKPASELAAIAQTSTCRRVTLGERIAVTGRDGAELAARLRHALAEREPRRAPGRIVLYLSRADLPAGTTDPAALAALHRAWLARCAGFGLFPERVVLRGIEPAFVRAWLWQRAEPGGLAYLDQAAGDALRGFSTGEAAIGESAVAEVGAAEWFEDAQVLALGAPPCALPASTRWLRLDDEAALRCALAALFTAGIEIDWTPLEARRYRVVRDFPRRPFARRSFRSPRIDAALAGADAPREDEGKIHPLVRDRLAQPDGRVSCRLRTATAWLDFIDGHRVQGRRLLPASLLLELMRAVSADARGAAVTLDDARFRRPFDLDAPACDYLVQVDAPGEGARVAVWGRPADDAAAPWVEHASAACRLADTPPAEAEHRDWPAGGWRELDVGALYARHQAGDIVLGEDFRCLAALRVQGACSEAEVGPPRGAGHDATQRAALLIDACLQASAATREADDGLFLLAGVGEVALPAAEALPERLRARLVREACDEGYRFTITLADAAGAPVGRLREVLFRRVQAAQRVAPFHETAWEAVEWPARAAAPVHAALPAPDALDGLETSAVWAARFGLDGYDAYRGQIEQACAGIVADTLAELGHGGADVGDNTDSADMQPAGIAAAMAEIAPAQRRLFAHLLAVRGRGEAAPLAAGAARLDGVDAAFPQFHGETEFLRRCAAALPEVLRGRRNPLEVLFGGSAFDGSEAVYVDSPIARVLNGQLAQWAARLAAQRPLRIVEIGAGTGGTSRTVLDALRGLPVARYCYTDVSPLFLERARPRFGEAGFIDYRLLDIEQPIADQGFTAGEFDLVIAANVLHATRSIADTLRQVRELLALGGYLLLRECTAPRLSADLSFGMTEGWWRFEDHALRADYAVLPVGQWERQLALAGFERTLGLPPSEASAEALIVAQASAVDRAEHWLVVHDGQGAGCVAQLAREGMACRELSWAEALVADPAREAYRHIVCFADAGERDNADPVAAARAQYEALIALCRRWLGPEAAPGARLWCVTRQAERAVDADRVDGLGQSVAAGVLKCAALEFPGRVAGLVDLEAEPADFAALVAHWREPGELRCFALRGGRPHVPRLRPLDTGAPGAASLAGGAFDGTVLITGGFGGIGLALADTLAARVETLVLVGRRIDGAEREARLAALRERGARVIALAADLADEAQVAALFARLAAEGVTVSHLVHAAGVGGSLALAASGHGALREVVDAKLAGTWHLHRHAGPSLKSFTVLSTMLALWGAREKAHYTLANHFAERVVEWRRARGLPAAIVHLGPVDGGMLDAAGKAAAARVGVRSFTLRELAGWLAAPLPRAGTALLDIDWSRFRPIYRHGWLDALFDELGTSADGGAAGAKAADGAAAFRHAYAAAGYRESMLDELLHALLREVLGLSGGFAAYAGTGFHDLGMDSLLTLSFAEKLGARVGLPVSSVDIFDNANPARLRGWLAARLRALDAAAPGAAGGAGGAGVADAAHPGASAAPASAATVSPIASDAAGDAATDEIERELQMMQALLEDR